MQPYVSLFLRKKHLCLSVLGLSSCSGFSLIAVRGYSLVVVLKLLIAVASLAVEHRL